MFRSRLRSPIGKKKTDNKYVDLAKAKSLLLSEVIQNRYKQGVTLITDPRSSLRETKSSRKESSFAAEMPLIKLIGEANR